MSKLLFFLAMILPATSFAENRENCEEACWACSASESALRSKYGSPRIPSRFKFAQRYDDMTSQEYKRCMAPHGPMAVLNRDISGRCTKQANSLCKRKCNTDLGSSYPNKGIESQNLQESKARTWHCLCYKEKIRGLATESTACRKTAKECWRLHGKVDNGTKILVEDSQGESCYQVRALHPHLATSSSKSQWRRSKRAGAWWTPKGCFLNESMTASPGESIGVSPPRVKSNAPSRRYGARSSYRPSRSIGGSCSSLSSCKRSCAQSHCSVVASCINNCMSMSGESLYGCVSEPFQTRCSGRQ